MGTKVQCENYLPAYYTRRDPREDGSSSYSAYYDRHVYDALMSNSVNSLDYDMEILRRTMLDHDAVFRKQVYELHRLYRIQKDLMEEFKMKELRKDCALATAAQSCSFLSQIRSEVTGRMPLMHQLPDGMMTPINFLNECGKRISPAPFSKANGVFQKDSQSCDSKTTKFPTKMFDLELPAEVYINNEDAARTEDETIVSPLEAAGSLCIAQHPVSEDDLKLSLGVSNHRSMKCGSYSHSQNVLPTPRIADLNEPVKYTCIKEEKDAIQINFSGRELNHKEILQHQKQTTPCLNFSGANKETRNEWFLFNHGSGQVQSTSSSSSPNLGTDGSPTSSVKQKKVHENYATDQSRTDTWFGERPNNGAENSKRIHPFSIPSYSRSTSQTRSAFPIPCSNNPNSVSPMVSTSRKPENGITHIPIAVQALPCFTGSLAMNMQSRSSQSTVQNQNLGNVWDRWRTGDLKSFSNSKGECSWYHNHTQSDPASASHMFSTSFRSGKPSLDKFGENLAYENLDIHGSKRNLKSPQLTDMKSMVDAKDLSIQNGIQAKQGKGIGDTGWRCEEFSGCKSWLRAKPPSCVSADENYTLGCRHFSSSNGKKAQELELGQKVETSPSMSIFPISTSSEVEERRLKSNEFCNGLKSKSILGFALNAQVEENGNKVYRNQLYLNSSVICLDVSEASEILPDSMVAATSPLVTLNFCSGIASGIDLGVPTTYHREDISIPKSNSMQKQVQMSPFREDGLQVNDPVLRAAAENIIAMSADTCGHLKDTSCHSLPSVSCHSLQWFADVVSSISENAGVLIPDQPGYHDGNDLDSFESMTLELKENEDKYAKWSRPVEEENPNDDGETNTASLILTKPRRGQARRRRQRRDFQRDILPGLSSLARHEVTEDLQTLEAMMKAADIPWCGTSRNGANGQGRGRGRRRTRNVVVTVEEIPASAPPTQPASREAEVETGVLSMTGWGRTRQCRRRRH